MIHETAVIGSEVKLGKNVTVGPFAVIDGPVSIGDECRIGPHCHICGDTSIGARTKIHAGAVIGDEPQDHGYHDQASSTEIGNDCVIREYVTIHRGSREGNVTRIGNNAMLMGFVHIGHDCQIADRVVIANNCMIAGHVEIGEKAFLSGAVAVHQFARIGRLAMIASNQRISQDVAPFCMVGDEGAIVGPNSVGLRRAGLTSTQRSCLKEAIKTFFFRGLAHEDALIMMQEMYADSAQIADFIEFVRNSKRGMLAGNSRQVRLYNPDRD